MPATGTTTFFDPGDYQAGFPGAAINLAFTAPGVFTARLTSVSLRHLKLFSVQESLPRIAYVSLPSNTVNFTFAMLSRPPPIWGGIKMQSRDLMFHGVGERLHQRTNGISRWGMISIERFCFDVFSRALTGSKLIPPRVGRVLRPSRANAAELQRLQAKVCHLAETYPQKFNNPEIARAIENDLIHALISCLAADVAHEDTAARRRHATIMNRFEKALASKFDRQLPIPELCRTIEVPERSLRMCCFDILGMSPSDYMRLRRLNLVRGALQHANAVATKVSEIARRYGFEELGRFAAYYRTIFGETPSATLHHSYTTLRQDGNLRITSDR